MELLRKIINSYISNLPNLKEMQKYGKNTGWVIGYEYTFIGRWLRWICFFDCDYILKHDMASQRNYTI